MSERSFSAVPIFEFEEGRQTNKLINGSGIRFLHHMYSPRSLAAYAALWAIRLSNPKAQALLRFCLSGINNYISRKQGYFGGGGGVAGTLFTPSIHLERNVFDVLRRKLNKLPSQVGAFSTIVSCQSASGVFCNTLGAVDYIFVDRIFSKIRGN